MLNYSQDKTFILFWLCNIYFFDSVKQHAGGHKCWISPLNKTHILWFCNMFFFDYGRPQMLNFSPEQDKGIFSLLPLFINLPPMLLSFSRRNIWVFRSIIFDSLSPDSTDFLDFIFHCVIWQTHVYNISAYFYLFLLNSIFSEKFDQIVGQESDIWPELGRMICLCLISVESRTKKGTKEKYIVLLSLE